jgi:heptosyltransferase II
MRPGGRGRGAAMPEAPILLVPYMWIGDFVRCHTVIKLLKQRFPARPIDVLTTAMVAPLLDYMPGVRKGIVVDLPRARLAWGQHRALAERLRAQGYGQALIMPRTWKSALAPALAGIPQRTGFVGEARFGVINDLRFGERRLPRMIDRCATLALPKGETAPADWPLPELKVSASELATWRQRLGLVPDGRPVVALAPGAVGPSKRWPVAYYADLARQLAAEGTSTWVIGGPGEQALAAEIVRADPRHVRDLTGSDLRNAILALAAATAAVSNDSGLLHVAAALGTPAIGIFGPTSSWHWAPLNPIAAVIETAGELPCRPCHKPVCRFGHHRCMRDISVDRVASATREAVAAGAARPAI